MKEVLAYGNDEEDIEYIATVAGEISRWHEFERCVTEEAEYLIKVAREKWNEDGDQEQKEQERMCAVRRRDERKAQAKSVWNTYVEEQRIGREKHEVSWYEALGLKEEATATAILAGSERRTALVKKNPNML